MEATIAKSGLATVITAKLIVKVPFWIPDSIAIVRAYFTFKLSHFEVKKPRAIVIELKKTSMPKVSPMFAINESNSFTKIIIITSANNNANADCTGASILYAKPGAFFLLASQ